MQPYSLFMYSPPYDKWATDTDAQIERVALRLTLNVMTCGMIWFMNLMIWFVNYDCPLFRWPGWPHF